MTVHIDVIDAYEFVFDKTILIRADNTIAHSGVIDFRTRDMDWYYNDREGPYHPVILYKNVIDPESLIDSAEVIIQEIGRDLNIDLPEYIPEAINVLRAKIHNETIIISNALILSGDILDKLEQLQSAAAILIKKYNIARYIEFAAFIYACGDNLHHITWRHS